MPSRKPKKPGRTGWYDLKIVLEVARAGSIKRAAARLKITESTTSRHVTAMEHDLGIDLFERTASRMALTKSGQELMRYLLRAEAEMEAGLEAAQNLQHVAAGSVRLTAVPTLVNHILVPPTTRNTQQSASS